MRHKLCRITYDCSIYFRFGNGRLAVIVNQKSALGYVIPSLRFPIKSLTTTGSEWNTQGVLVDWKLTCWWHRKSGWRYMYAYPRFSRFPMIVPLERLRKWVSLNRLKSVQTVISLAMLENSTSDGVSKVDIQGKKYLFSKTPARYFGLILFAIGCTERSNLQNSALNFLQDWNRSLKRPGSVWNIEPFFDLHKDLAWAQSISYCGT